MPSWVETEDASSSQSMPWRKLLPCPTPSSPHLTPCTGSGGSALSAPMALHSVCVMSPCFNPKTHTVCKSGIWAGLSQAGARTTISPAMRASHFLQGGKKNPEVAGDGREGGGKVLGSDGKNKAVGFGKKDRLMERSSQCYFCPWRGLAAARPVSGKGRAQCFLLNAQSNPLPFWL